MGLSYSVYAGPFFRCKGFKQEWDINNKHVDVLFQINRENSKDKEHFWGPNQIRNIPNKRKFSLNPREDSGGLYCTLRSEDIENEIIWLNRNYTIELELLRAAYETVSSDWGILSDVS